MSQCPSCGAGVTYGARACSYCGRGLSTIEAPAAGEAPTTTETPVAVDLEPALSGRGGGAGGLVLVAGIVGGVMVIGLLAWTEPELRGLFRPHSEARPWPAADVPAVARKAPTPRRTAPAVPASALELLSLRDEARAAYRTVQGEVRNVSTTPVAQLQAVVTWYDRDGTMITSDVAAVELNPVLPGQASRFTVRSRSHREMYGYAVVFRTVNGGTIAARDVRNPSSADGAKTP
jgi:hypothetical protein